MDNRASFTQSTNKGLSVTNDATVIPIPVSIVDQIAKFAVSWKSSAGVLVKLSI
jgi:hypothetical protein